MQLHDTYFVVAHFHYTMMGGTVMGFFAGLHYWFPKMTGKMLNEKIARIAWALVFVGFNVTFFTMFIVGVRGMPRRYAEYLPKFQVENVISTIGSAVLARRDPGDVLELSPGLAEGPARAGEPVASAVPGVADPLAARHGELPRDPRGDRLAVRLRETGRAGRVSAPPAEHGDPRVAFEAAKLGLWTFLATEVLLFGALFTAYTVFRVKYPALFQSEHLKLNRVLGTLNTARPDHQQPGGGARRGRDPQGEGASAGEVLRRRRFSWGRSSSA